MKNIPEKKTNVATSNHMYFFPTLENFNSIIKTQWFEIFRHLFTPEKIIMNSWLKN